MAWVRHARRTVTSRACVRPTRTGRSSPPSLTTSRRRSRRPTPRSPRCTSLGDRPDLASQALAELGLTMRWVLDIVGVEKPLAESGELRAFASIHPPFVHVMSLVQVAYASQTAPTGKRADRRGVRDLQVPAPLHRYRRLCRCAEHGLTASLIRPKSGPWTRKQIATQPTVFAWPKMTRQEGGYPSCRVRQLFDSIEIQDKVSGCSETPKPIENDSTSVTTPEAVDACH